MSAKRAMEYRTKLLSLARCNGDQQESLDAASALVNAAVNDKPLLDAGWELHDIVGLARSQRFVQTFDDTVNEGPIFVLVVFRRPRVPDAAAMDEARPTE